MKSIITNLFLSIIVTFTCIYILEAGLGIFLKKSLARRPVPAGAQHIHTTKDYTVVYKYNNISMRGDDFSPDKAYDITLLGDSFLFGQGVDEDATLYGILKTKGCSVLNASEVATNPLEYYRKIRILLNLGLQTKYIVMGLFIGNDFQGIQEEENLTIVLNSNYDNHPFSYYTSLMPSFLCLARIRSVGYAAYRKIFFPGSPSVRRFEKKQLFVTDWIEWFVRGDDRMMEGIRNRKYKPMSSDGEYLAKAMITTESIKMIQNIINTLYDYLKPENRLLLLVIPDLHHVSGELGQAYEDTIHSFFFGLRPEIQLIDLHGVMQPSCFFSNDGHWNEKGHRVVVEAILDNIAPTVGGIG